MSFLAAENISSDLLRPCVPWEFVQTEEISLQIRKVKEDRQNWCKSKSTKHCFYTGIEPVNPNLRINESNPPLLLHHFVADYDLEVPDARIDEAIAAMKIKPSWVERSLGGNFRLVWDLEAPLRVSKNDFCVFVLLQARSWLALDILPELDEGAWKTPNRLFCNGCVWRKTGHGPIPQSKSQPFFVECAKKFQFTDTASVNIPMEVIEAAIRRKYPDLSWPAAFEEGSQGPSFWVPGSTSPSSAIVKKDGIISFAAHAEKFFTPWSDPALLGPDFVKDYIGQAITRATADCFWDGHNYYRKRHNDAFSPMEKDEFVIYLKGDCKLSSKPGPDGLSAVEDARRHIHNNNWVKSAGPFVMRKPGPFDFQNERFLNTYAGKPLEPAAGTQKWGEFGNFTWLSHLLDVLYVPTFPQLDHWKAWFQHFYRSAYLWLPYPGQFTILSGAMGCGKTLVNREVVGASVGGYVDASGYIVYGEAFNAHLFQRPHWVIDDDVPSSASRTKLAAAIKKLVSNQQFVCNEKFLKQSMVEWMGRLGITTNLDQMSMRILGSLDHNSMEKMSLFKCTDRVEMQFPNRYEIRKILARELPYFLRYILDWTPPDFIRPHPRYGVMPYHNEMLLDRTHQCSEVSSFKELVSEALSLYFAGDPQATEFVGSAMQILRLLRSDGTGIANSYKPEQVNRYLEQLKSEHLLECETITDSRKFRLWKFPRPRTENPEMPLEEKAAVCNPNNNPNPFQS